MSSFIVVLLGSISGLIFLSILLTMLMLINIDFRKRRKAVDNFNCSVIIPCFNDALSIVESIESVFRCFASENLDLIIVNDGSSDDSASVIEKISQKYPMRVITNAINKGKANSINSAVPLAKHDLILFLDADTILNKRSLFDMFSRINANPKLGAVSCPYRPKNTGLLPLFQHIDYNMFMLSQGACNVFSALGLWGGCLMTRRAAFDSINGFSNLAIADDFDYAFRLNRARWHVVQSFYAVHTLVPETIRGWARQKLRWTSGGMQCYIRYFTTWVKNPIQVFFFASYAFFLVTTFKEIFDGVELEGVIAGLFFFCLPSICYIIPMLQRWLDAWKFILIVPFSLIYLPIYMCINFVGLLIGIRSLIAPKKTDTQAWVN